MDLFTLWEKVMQRIQQENPQYANIFYQNIFPVDFSRNVLTLMVKTPYLINWLQNVYVSDLEALISKEAGVPCKVNISGSSQNNANPAPAPVSQKAPQPVQKAPEPAPLLEDDQPAPQPEPEDEPFPKDAPPADILHLQPKKAEDVVLPDIRDYQSQGGEISLFDEPPKTRAREDQHYTPINREYTFNNFVHGNCNEMAYQAAFSVAKTVEEPPDQRDLSLNPLFIYGESGLGKTHLLHAIANFVHEKKPSLKVIFVTSEQFTNDLIQAIQNHTMEKFRNRYRTADFLLIDDVQFFGSRDSTKMEIFNTFNDLFDRKKFIILTSDRTPDNIEKLEDRLKTRFRSGLVVEISKPDYEICTVILQRRAQADHVDLPKDVIDLVASNINENVRELEGAYNKLVSFSRIEKKPITLDFAKDTLKEEIPFENRHVVTNDDIIDTVCKYFNVKREKLMSKGRPKNIVYPRQLAMYLCREMLNESYPSLRDIFHRKDHSTILYACDRVKKDLKTDEQTQKDIMNIKELLKKI